MAIVIGIFGVCGWDIDDSWLHSAGASLWIDGEHSVTISEERLSRIKYDGRYPENSIKYCLDHANIERDDVDFVVYVHNIHSSSRNRENKITKILKREFESAKIKFVDHHIAHASAAFYTSGFDDSMILSFDGSGNLYTRYDLNNNPIIHENEVGFLGFGCYKEITILHHFLNSYNKSIFMLGETYNAISRYVYSRIEPEKTKKIKNIFLFMESAPGKIMGLSAHGNRHKVNDGDGIIELFDINYVKSKFPEIINKFSINGEFEKKLFKFDEKDIADWLQYEFERILVEYFECLFRMGLQFSKNLCMSGGCALNVLANTAIYMTGLFDNIHIFPATNDSGLCFGGALSVVREIEDEIILPKNLASLGKTYTTEEILEVIENEN